MTADEAGVVDHPQELLLRRADVGDDAAGRPGGERVADELRERADRGASEAELGAFQGLVQRARRVVDRAQLAGALEPGPIPPEPDDLGAFDMLPRREADRPADQPDAEYGDPQTASSCLPASSATASTRRR
jgi:hypothetical protein